MLSQKYLDQISHGGYKSFLKRAGELGLSISVIKVENTSLLKISYQDAVLFCKKQNMPIMRRMGNLTKNKLVTKLVLESVGISTPRGVVATSSRQAIREIRKARLSYPLITKPIDGSLARGVTWNILTEKDVSSAVDHALSAYGKRVGVKILVEEMFVGSEYRVLVFNGKVLSCVEKVPAGVTGDGISTIEELVHIFNKSRRLGFKIKLDGVAKASLKKAGLTLKSVLPKKYFFRFRNNLNMSDGGRSIDRTKIMSPLLKKTCVAAVEAVGLTYGGVDLITNHLSSKNPRYIILEINPNPFFNMHEKPLVEGLGVDVSETILRYFFPNLPR